MQILRRRCTLFALNCHSISNYLLFIFWEGGGGEGILSYTVCWIVAVDPCRLATNGNDMITLALRKEGERIDGERKRGMKAAFGSCCCVFSHTHTQRKIVATAFVLSTAGPSTGPITERAAWLPREDGKIGSSSRLSSRRQPLPCCMSRRRKMFHLWTSGPAACCATNVFSHHTQTH